MSRPLINRSSPINRIDRHDRHRGRRRPPAERTPSQKPDPHQAGARMAAVSSCDATRPAPERTTATIAPKMKPPTGDCAGIERGVEKRRAEVWELVEQPDREVRD